MNHSQRSPPAGLTDRLMSVHLSTILRRHGAVPNASSPFERRVPCEWPPVRGQAGRWRERRTHTALVDDL